jgi:hypothetical protein
VLLSERRIKMIEPPAMSFHRITIVLVMKDYQVKLQELLDSFFCFEI